MGQSKRVDKLRYCKIQVQQKTKRLDTLLWANYQIVS